MLLTKCTCLKPPVPELVVDMVHGMKTHIRNLQCGNFFSPAVPTIFDKVPNDSLTFMHL